MPARESLFHLPFIQIAKPIMTPLRWLQNYTDKARHSVIGLMSGTSLDGVDAAWVEIAGSGSTLQVRLRGFLCIPFPQAEREKLLRLCHGASVSEVAVAHVEMGEVFAASALQLMKECGLNASDIDLIGSHGQTICHLPQHSASLQIGDACVIAERTGITTVADFRARDLACGGQGAPLVPYVDWCLLQRPDRHRIVQNLGGIANCTLLPAGGTLDDVRAWDSGPGNMIIDQIARTHSQGREHFDRDGRLAASGKADEAWLEELMRHSFFHRAPPKSAGREEFGAAFAANLMAQAQCRGMSTQDTIATATALTAASVAHSYRTWAEPYLRNFDTISAGDFCAGDLPVEVTLCGGGASNPTLAQMLRERLISNDVSYHVLIEEDGVRADAKEAVAFAILAHESMMGTPCNAPGATGATRPVSLGKIAFANAPV